MTINRQHTTEIEDAILDPFRTQIEMPRDKARALVEQEGLNGLRIRVAAKLYATEHLTSGEAANRVGLRNRGLLLRHLEDNQIPPAPKTTRTLKKSNENSAAGWRNACLVYAPSKGLR